MTVNTPKNSSEPSPILLTDGAWLGTLAAARDLGSRGVPVTLATPTNLAPARWSRHVRSTVVAPRTNDRSKFLEWLLDFGERRPGHVLYPTSDDLAWLLAAHGAELSESFHVFPLARSSLVQLLDKAKLTANARAAGFKTPATTVPKDEEELVKCADELGYPVFIKPRVQLFGAGTAKGTLVKAKDELLPAWREIRHGFTYDPDVLAEVPDIALPVVQACAEKTERIYTLNGYFDANSGAHTIIACTKILQRPRGKGPGIIFEHSPTAPGTEKSLETMFRSVGYSGVYDVEFLESGSDLLLIDINPRFYNHMAFEVERGMPLPWLAYLGASGRTSELAEAIAQCNQNLGGPQAYVHPIPIQFMLFAQTLSGGMTREDRQRWRTFVSNHVGKATNPVRTNDDPRPQIGELAMLARGMLLHPRAFWKGLFYFPR